MEERRKFLLKKGLNSSEIDEAIRLAKPDLDRITPQQATIATATSPSNVVASLPQQPAPAPSYPLQTPVPASQPMGFWQMFLAAAALVGLGTGLGVLVKKLVPGGLISGGSEAASQASLETALLLGKLDSMQASIDSNSRWQPAPRGNARMHVSGRLLTGPTDRTKHGPCSLWRLIAWL